MEDEYLADCLIIYLEIMIAEKFNIYSIIDEFYDIRFLDPFLLIIVYI